MEKHRLKHLLIEEKQVLAGYGGRGRGGGGDSSKEKYFVASHCAAGDVLIRYYLFLIW